MSRPASPRPLGQAPQLGQPVGDPVHRRPGDHQQPEPADQREQRRGDPRRQRGHQRGRDEEADQPGAGPHGALPGGRLRRARRDVHQPEPAQQQAAPADHHPAGLRVAVGVAQEPPGEQAEQQRHSPGGRAERAEEQVGQHPPGEVVHVEPGGGGDHEGRRQEGQAHAVPLVQRVQVPCAACRTSARRTRPRARPPSTARPPAGPASRPGSGSGRPSAAAAAPRPPRGRPLAGRPLPALSRPVLSRRFRPSGSALTVLARRFWPERSGRYRRLFLLWRWREGAGIAFALLAARPLAGRPAPPDERACPPGARACPAAGRACPPGASALGRGVPLATRVAMMPKVPTIRSVQPQACGRVAMIFGPGERRLSLVWRVREYSALSVGRHVPAGQLWRESLPADDHERSAHDQAAGQDPDRPGTPAGGCRAAARIPAAWNRPWPWPWPWENVR